MKLRLNSSNYDLAFRFGISESTVGRIFARWIEAMDIRLSFLIAWPDRADLHKTMPFCYRINYGLKITSTIDCFELFIEKPSNLLAKACTWSQYKHYNTARYLISIIPQDIIIRPFTPAMQVQCPTRTVPLCFKTTHGWSGALLAA